MPYQQPTLSELQAAALNDIVASNVSSGRALLPRSILRVLAWVLANLTWGNYDYLAFCYRQAVPWTATDEYLDGWGAMKGVTRKAATASVLALQSTGGTSGTDCPAGTLINRNDGVIYETNADAVVDAAGTITVQVTCQTTGSGGNCAVNTAFSLQSPIGGINASFVSTASITEGTDQETDDALQARIRQAWSAIQGGGKAADYVTWAEDYAPVTRAWCLPNGQGTGTVVVYVMMDDAEAANGGYPQGTNGAASTETRWSVATGDQLAVANAIQPNQPVTALVIVAAPTAYPIPIEISGLVPNTTAQKTAINAALADLWASTGTPLGMTISPATIEAAILSTGATAFTTVSPLAPVTVPIGYLPSLPSGGVVVS